MLRVCLVLFCIQPMLSLAGEINNQQATVSFFLSNNDKVISLPVAFKRLHGVTQDILRDQTIEVLQLKRIQQGRFTDVLGRYQMTGSGKVTADNSERFDTSPYQYLSPQKINTLAKVLAGRFHQDRVAVFIPDQQAKINRITVKFDTKQPTIKQLSTEVATKLSASYQKSYSLYLTSCENNFSRAHVQKIEWMGQDNQLVQIQRAFPHQEITWQKGRYYLVYGK